MREDRLLSLAVAEHSGIKHESPQVICFVRGKAVGHASHYGITTAAMKGLLASR